MAYRIQFKPSAYRDLKSLSKANQGRIIHRVEALAANPRPFGAKELKGERDLYHIRVGDYRIVYQVRDKVLVVLVLRVRHRRDAYEGL